MSVHPKERASSKIDQEGIGGAPSLISTMDNGNEHSREIVSATFTCSECGKKATTVTLVPLGVHHPDLKARDPSTAFVMLDGPHCIRQSAVPDDLVEALVQGLRGNDAAAIAGLPSRFGWAPFYCPECDACYCIEHTDVRHFFDQGFHDGAQGICPRGHERWLD